MKGHPKGLISAALSNMGERFGHQFFISFLYSFITIFL